jgi:hypothetical protein
MKKNIFTKEIKVADAKTSVNELTRETLINFCWGFFGNSIVVFMAKEIDMAVLINFFLYSMLISNIVHRNKYESNFGKFVVLPGSAALGAYTGYKVAQIISAFL